MSLPENMFSAIAYLPVIIVHTIRNCFLCHYHFISLRDRNHLNKRIRMILINNYSSSFFSPLILFCGEGKIIMFSNFDFNLF
jgi:hypothetical protein